MDYDTVMLYVKNNPDCTSLDLSSEFGVTVAKAFTFMNKMVRHELVYKTKVRSPTNNKKIYGYRTIEGFDEFEDGPHGEIPYDELRKILTRCRRVHGEEKAMLHLYSCNDWRAAHGLEGVPVEVIYD